jgi:hypothetical protein
MTIFHILKSLATIPSHLPNPDSITNGSAPKIFINIVLGIAASTSVLVVVLAGLRYTFSQGEPEQTQKAKNAIIYASVGLGVSFLAFVIVNFVVNNLF